MTKEEILALQLGPEMDALVMSEVMGGASTSGDLPGFSTDIAAAWEVLKKFEWVQLLKGQMGLWTCTIRKYRGTAFKEFQALSRQAPEAICRAALQAVALDNSR